MGILGHQRRPVDNWRLVMAHHAWTDAWRSLSINQQAWAVGSLRWNLTHRTRELIAEELSVSDSLPDGSARLAADEWVAVGFADFSDAAYDIEQVVQRLQPRVSQTLLVFLVDRNDPSLWDAAVFRRQHLHRLDQVMVVGPSMLCLDRRGGPKDEKGLADEINLPRFSRIRGALGDQVMRKVLDSEITIIGVGRTGSAAAFQLASLGVRRIRIIDGDRLGIENMDAMIGLTTNDIGQKKAVALAQRLEAFRDDISLSVIDKSILDAGAAYLLRQRSHLVVTCVDHDTARLAVANAARQTLTAHLDIGTGVQRTDDGALSIRGDARLLLPGLGCVACVGGMADLESTHFQLQLPADHFFHSIRPNWDSQRAGSLVTVNAITVGAGIQMWLDLLANELTGSFWQRIRWQTAQGLQTDSGYVSAASDCKICQNGHTG